VASVFAFERRRRVPRVGAAPRRGRAARPRPPQSARTAEFVDAVRSPLALSRAPEIDFDWTRRSAVQSKRWAARAPSGLIAKPKKVEARGIEPRSENVSLHASTYVADGLYRPRRAHRQALRVAIHLFVFALRPVDRRLASQLGHALPEALAGLVVGRLRLLVRQRERVRCRSQLYVPRIFTWISGPRYAAVKSTSPSKPIAPFRGSTLEHRCLRRHLQPSTIS